MPDYTLPFPGRELADQELTYDVCYAKILPQARASIADSGLVCECVDKDYISGNQRYFSDYISGQSRIHLYLGAIRLWAQENGMTLETAQNVILSHEYFHFLEWTKLGLTSREYQVPMLKLGPLKLGKTGVRALSEIGAHAFARTYYELTEERERKDEATGI